MTLKPKNFIKWFSINKTIYCYHSKSKLYEVQEQDGKLSYFVDRKVSECLEYHKEIIRKYKLTNN